MPSDPPPAGPPADLQTGAIRPALVAAFGTHALGDIDLPTLLQAASESAAEGMGVKRAKVLCYRPEAGDLLVVAGVNWRPGVVGHATLPATLDSPPGAALLTSQPTAIADLPRDRQFTYSGLLRDHGIVSLLNVPIRTDSDNWGVLEADSERPGVFGAEHVHFLQGLANVLGAAIRRLNAEEAARARSDRLRILSETAGELLAARDPDVVLAQLFPDLNQSFDIDAAFSYLADEAAGHLRMVSCHGVTPAEAQSVQRLEFGAAVSGRVAQIREPIYAARIQESRDDWLAALRQLGIRAYVCHPLLAGERLLGTLSFGSRRRDTFSDGELSFFRTVASYVGVVRQRLDAERSLAEVNAALEQRVAQRTRMLAESIEQLRLEIQERGRIEADLRQREADYRALYNNAPAPQHSLDAAGNIIGVSDYWLDLMGYARHEVLGRPLTGFLTPDSAARFTAGWPRVLETPDGQTAEIHLVKRTGEVMEAIVSRRVERDELGRFVRTLGVLTDVTALRRVERERDRLFEFSQDLLLIAGIDGTVRDINPALEQALGVSLAAVRGTQYLRFVHPDDRRLAADAVRTLTARQDVGPVELRYRCHDGSWRWTSWRATAVPAEGLIYASGRDITQQRAAEAALRQAQKMEAVGHLTGGIAHDFNNLLTVIMGNVELLRGRLSGQPRLLRLIAGMQHAASRGEELTRQLLAFSRHQMLNPEVLDANVLIREFEPLIRRAVPESIHMHIRLAPGLWPTLIDAGQLEAALLNLAVNAVDAMPSGGRLVIETQNIEQNEQLPARVPGASPGPYVLVAVSDTGTGIPPGVIDRVFEPFFTTKQPGKGTGLGLSQIYGFVEQSGGHVTVDSEVGSGTTFRLYLPPASGDAAASAAREQARSTQPHRGSERILVVEDNPDVLGTTTVMLMDLGYDVRTAADGAAALGLLQSGEQIDLLFSDIAMPQMSGVALAMAAVTLHPGLKVLLTSGYNPSGLPGRAEAERYPVLAKPYRQADLAARIRAILDGDGTPGGA